MVGFAAKEPAVRPQVDVRCYGSARVQGAQVVISA
jgi:hypothetical protein